MTATRPLQTPRRWRMAAFAVMRLLLIGLATAAAVGARAAPPLAAPQERPTPPAIEAGRFVPGHVLVGVDPHATPQALAQVFGRVGAQSVRSDAAGGMHTLSTPAGQEIATIQRLRSNPLVRYAEPDYIRHLHLVGPPNDPLFPQQWNLNIIQAASGWNLFPDCSSCQGGAANGVLVAMVDSGIDLNNLDLANQGTGDPDVYGHGTHVAGIIAARLNDFFGTVGLAFNSRIASYRACDGKGDCDDGDVINSINAAVAIGAKVINLSLGSGNSSTALCEAVGNATRAGVVVVASAGNRGTIGLDYPAACSGTGVIAVAASDANDQFASFSNRSFGADFLVTAPGVAVMSTLPTNAALKLSSPTGTGVLSGTSMSAPHVTALVALMRGLNPGLEMHQLKQLIAMTTDKVGGGYRFIADDFCLPAAHCSWNDQFGYGRINVSSALCAAHGGRPIVQSIAPSGGPVGGGTTLTITGACLAQPTSVRVGNAPGGSVTSVSPSQITLVTPAADNGGLADVVVTTSGGQSLSGPQSRFAYGPVITQVSPSGGAVGGGTVVTVLGQGFGAGLGGAGTPSFRFGGPSGPLAEAVRCTGPGACQMLSPGASSAGTVDVVVTSGGVTSPQTPVDRFSYGAPSIDHVSPQAGPQDGRSYVNITGSNFVPGTGMTVNFGTRPSPYVNCSSDHWCQAYSPAGSGTVDIEAVVNNVRSTHGPADLYTYAPQPAIVSITPPSGPATGGDSVVLLGSNYAIGSRATHVMFGATPATSVVCNNTSSCIVTSPPGAGNVDVTVEVGGVSSPLGHSYAYVPVVQSVSPTSGPRNGGTAVVVKGAGFTTGKSTDPMPSVSFGSASVSAACTADTCQVASPSGTGDVDVQVSFDGNRSATTPADRFSYLAEGGTKGWTHWLPSDALPPSGLASYDAARQVLLVLGQGDTAVETWTWSVAGWQRMSPVHVPLTGTAMAYDAARGNTVLFGQLSIAKGRSRLLPGTLIWDGGDWHALSPSRQPSARWRESMVYDATRQQVLLFGGCADIACTQPLNDLWAWNGSDWTQLSSAALPSPRFSAAMSRMAGNGDIVLFGGGTHNQAFINETWVWNGTAWTLQSPAHVPTAQNALAMAPDAASGGVVLIGGPAGSSSATDTWLWNGSDWTPLPLATHPNVVPMGFSPDPARGLDWLVDLGGQVWSWGGRP